VEEARAGPQPSPQVLLTGRNFEHRRFEFSFFSKSKALCFSVSPPHSPIVVPPACTGMSNSTAGPSVGFCEIYNLRDSGRGCEEKPFFWAPGVFT